MPDEDLVFNRAVLRGETRAQWAARFYEAAARSGRVFRTSDENLLVVPESAAPKRIFSPDQFDGVLGEIVNVVQALRDEDEGDQRMVTTALSRPEIMKLFFSEQKKVLPQVSAVVHEPVVVPAGNGTYVVTQPGYNPGTGVYYYVAPGEVPVVPVEGIEALKFCFSAVPFESQHYAANLMAWLLGGVCLDPLLDPPLLVVSGNQQGIGKSSVVQAAGTIVTGVTPSPISPHGGEFAKQVSAQFLENSRFLFLDNIVVRGTGSYDNTQLSTLLTQGFSKKMRILGHSRHVSASGILVAASLNDAKLSVDLATRSLAVKLCSWQPRLHVPYCKHYATENRRRLYGELLWLALQGRDDASTDERYIGFRFRRWLNFVRPRIEKHFGELAVTESCTLDEITQELYHLGLDWADTPFTVAEFLQRLAMKTSQFPALAQKRAGIPSERGAQTAFGQLLSGREGQALSLDGTVSVTLESKTSRDGKLYSFKVQ